MGKRKGRLSFDADAKKLAELASVAASVVPAKSVKPVMKNLLMEAMDDGTILVTGSDLEVTARVKVESVEVAKKGAVLVDASQVVSVLRELATSEEKVSVSGARKAGCVLEGADARFEVFGIDPEEYPEVGLPPRPLFSFGASDFKDMVARTHFAAHQEKTRYAMNGVLVHAKHDMIRLVATDGKRLAMCERRLADPTSKEVNVVVPAKALSIIQRMIGDEGVVDFSIDGAHAHLVAEGVSVTARLVEGSFPPYEDVIPKNHDKEIRVPKNGFAQCVRRAALLGQKGVTLGVRLSFSNEGLVMTSRVPEVGESRIEFPLEYDYEPLESGFNPHYFLDVLKVYSGEEVDLKLKDKDSAAIISEPDAGYTYLVMPLSLGS